MQNIIILMQVFLQIYKLKSLQYKHCYLINSKIDDNFIYFCRNKEKAFRIAQ